MAPQGSGRQDWTQVTAGPNPTHIKVIAGAILATLLFVVFLMTYFTVQPFEAAVVTRFGSIAYVAEPGSGLHFKLPFVNSVHFLRTDIQAVAPQTGVNTYTVDNQEVDVLFNVFYRLPANQVAYVYQNVPDYRDRLYSMAIDRIKAEVGKVNVTDVAGKRGELRDAIKEILAHDALSLGVEVTDLQLTDLKYTDAFRTAVTAASVSKAGIEAQEYKRQQAEKDAQTTAITASGAANAQREQARGAADARLMQATAEAKAIQLQGDANASAIRSQAEALKSNPDLVRLREVEKWNGVRVPQNVFGNSPVPVMNLGAVAAQ